MAIRALFQPVYPAGPDQEQGSIGTPCPYQLWWMLRSQNGIGLLQPQMFNECVHSLEVIAERPIARKVPPEVCPSHYLCCMQLDENFLALILDGSRDWRVNIINRDWIPEEEGSDYEDSEVEDVEIPNELCQANVWPAIKGCTEEDIGWVKASWRSL